MPTRSKACTAEAGRSSRRAAAPPAPARASRPTRAEQHALKRDAVLRTAARMFNERGFHATSLDDVAERLQVTKPTLYYYVRSKDEILFECVRTGLQMLQDAIAQSAEGGGSALDKLMAAMRQYVRIVTADFGMCVIRVGEDPLPADSRRELRRVKASLDLEFRELIRQGIAEGSIVPCDPKLAAFAMAGALSWIGRWYLPDGPLTPEQIADQCISLLTRGLCGGEPRAEASLSR